MIPLPQEGRSAGDVLVAMADLREHDARWREGRTWSLVFHAGDEIADLPKQAYTMFFSETGLNPMAFPSLKRFEAAGVAMTADLLGGAEETVGNMTSGGPRAD